MKKMLITVLAAAAMLAVPATAFAETLDYDFTMTITSIDDGYGVFGGLSEGESLNVSVQFDTEANTDGGADGVAAINVTGLTVQATGGWSSGWSDVQYNGGSWDAYSGTIAQTLVVNGIGIQSGSVHQEVYLSFAQTSTGDLELTSGSMSLGVRNGHSADLRAEFVETPPSAVPELDPRGGMSAFALLGGGFAIALSSRRRRGALTLTAS
jgi:hypothetical protein